MDARPAWTRAWEWASEWRWSTSFWLIEVLVGAAAAVLTYFVTRDLGAAALWAGLGAVVVFPVALFGRWARLRFRDYEEIRLAVAAVSVPEPSGPDSDARQRFDAYVDQQLDRLQRVPALIRESETDWAMGEWDTFVKLAWQTTSGIRLFDEAAADYVTATISEVETDVVDVWNDREKMLSLADRVVESIGDTKHLFTGSG